MTLVVHECLACGAVAFPPRATCPRCAGLAWTSREVERGVVEVVTVHRDTAIGSVRMDAGPVVVVRNACASAPGDVVVLDLVGGAPTAVRLE